MTERPILFSGAMVRAILDGTKRQTRRMVKWEPGARGEARLVRLRGQRASLYLHDTMGLTWRPCSGAPEQPYPQPADACPYGAPGARLWVRESVRRAKLECLGITTNADGIQYVADGEFACDPYGFDYAWRWKRATLPSIHLPRWASRITLAVESVRVERLHDISEEDARAEGVEPAGGFMATAGCWTNYGSDGPSKSSARESFASLWQAINGAESWQANPFVWVVGFSRVEVPRG